MAFRDPQRADQIVIKRVVGLPGERVQIRDGDVYVNGQLARKNLSQQRAMAVSVYDANHFPHLDSNLPPRWSGQAPRSRWQISAGVFRHPGSDRPGVDWCEYHHWDRIGEKVVAGPIYDLCGYNQGHPRRMPGRP